MPIVTHQFESHGVYPATKTLNVGTFNPEMDAKEADLFLWALPKLPVAVVADGSWRYLVRLFVDRNKARALGGFSGGAFSYLLDLVGS